MDEEPRTWAQGVASSNLAAPTNDVKLTLAKTISVIPGHDRFLLVSVLEGSTLEPPGVSLREIARRRMEDRSSREPIVDYRLLAELFRSEPAVDPHGLGPLVAEIEQAGDLFPPEPPTLRGRVGRILIRLQLRTLWWLTRAISRRDRAWRAAYGMMLAIHEKQLTSHLDTVGRISEIEARLSRIEESFSGAKPKDGAA
jgi:hypothetical protein